MARNTNPDLIRIAFMCLACVAAVSLGAMALVTGELEQSAHAQSQAQLNVTAAGQLEDTPSLLLHTAIDVDTFVIGTGIYAAVASLGDDGIQIINVTDPDTPVSAGQLEDTPSLLLHTPYAVAVFETGGHTYAAVASLGDDGIQIINVTDPASPAGVGQVRDGGSMLLEDPRDVAVFETGGHTYAAAVSDEDGIQIINVTDPASPAGVGQLERSQNVLLNGTYAIHTFETGAKTYAAVASMLDDALQLVDVTDPASPVAAGSLADTTGLLLAQPRGVHTFETGAKTYAAVTSSDEDGIQIINVTDPASPAAVGNLEDDGNLQLQGSQGVDIFETGGRTYAAVASFTDFGIQLVDVTNPGNPTDAGRLAYDSELLLDEIAGIAIFETEGNAYAAVASQEDNGIQIVRFSHVDTMQPVIKPVCIPPASADWHIREGCMLESDTRVPAGIIIHAPATLTIPAGVTLDVDFATYGLLIKSGAGLLIMNGGGMR